MKTKSNVIRTLGPISAKFINEFLKNGKTLFTLTEAAAIYGGSNHPTGKFLSTLIKRGIIARIKSGVYLILQIGHENIQMGNWPIIVPNLVDGNHYYISHYSAMRLHGMTTHSLVDVYVTTIKRHREKKINTITYHFIYTNPEHFWGTSIHWVTKQDKINISDIERTLLDGLARPDLCGGIKEVIRGIWAKQHEINWEKMMQYIKRFHTKAAIKRLGFILEMLNLNINSAAILKTLAKANDYIFLDPQGQKEGPYLARWHIRLNMNIDELKASVWE